MLEMLGDVFSQAKTSREAVADADSNVDKFVSFAKWITIYGSDEAFRAYHNLTQSFPYDPPLPITLRLIADFMLSARKDIGYPETEVTRAQLVALRVTDFYQLGDKFGHVMTLPLDEACKLAGWSPPWSSMNAKAPVRGIADPGLTITPTQPDSSSSSGP